MFRRTGCGIALIAAIAASGPLVAQEPPVVRPNAQAGRQGGRANLPGGVNPARAVANVQELMDSRVLNLSQKELQLTDAQFPEFFRSMQRLQQNRRDHDARHNRLMGELRRLTNPNGAVDPDTAAIEARVKDLSDLEAATFQEEQRLIGVIDRVLTPFQRARFRIFEERMANQTLEMIAQAKAAARGGGPPKD